MPQSESYFRATGQGKASPQLRPEPGMGSSAALTNVGHQGSRLPGGTRARVARIQEGGSHRRGCGGPRQAGEQHRTARLGCEGQGGWTKPQAGGLSKCPSPCPFLAHLAPPPGLSVVLSLSPGTLTLGVCLPSLWDPPFSPLAPVPPPAPWCQRPDHHRVPPSARQASLPPFQPATARSWGVW